MNLCLAETQRSRVAAFMREHRTGLLAMVFTDVEGSTALKQALGDRESVALMRAHHALVREVLTGYGEGEEIGTAGDSFFIVFTKPSDAVRFALQLQTGMRSMGTAQQTTIKDRIGIHIGEVVIEEQGGSNRDLYGIQVDTCARVMSLAVGGQVLMTRGVFDNARQVLRGEELEGVGPLAWLNHGLYGLKGVEEAMEICEVGEQGIAPLAAPLDSEKAKRHSGMAGEPVLGWRPALGQQVPGTAWELKGKLGEGGFGEVWLGRHGALKEERVFKFCFRADRVRTLRREVTIWRLLKERLGMHPNIVPVREVYFEEPPYYIVMDYAPGEDLIGWGAKRGGLEKVELGLKLEIVAQTAEALGAAHGAGVIHRDVKPGNILVEDTATGGVRVRLTDFGIGEVMDKERVADVTLAGFTATLSGEEGRAGSQMYMAPEILSGKGAGAASDVYSLGVVLYQLLVGDLKAPLTTDWKRRIRPRMFRELVSKMSATDPVARAISGQKLVSEIRAAEALQQEVSRNVVKTQKRTAVIFRLQRWLGTILVLMCVGVMALTLPFEGTGAMGSVSWFFSFGAAGVVLVSAAQARYRGGWESVLGFLLAWAGLLSLGLWFGGLPPSLTVSAVDLLGTAFSIVGVAAVAIVLFANGYRIHQNNLKSADECAGDLPDPPNSSVKGSAAIQQRESEVKTIRVRRLLRALGRCMRILLVGAAYVLVVFFFIQQRQPPNNAEPLLLYAWLVALIAAWPHPVRRAFVSGLCWSLMGVSSLPGISTKAGSANLDSIVLASGIFIVPGVAYALFACRTGLRGIAAGSQRDLTGVKDIAIDSADLMGRFITELVIAPRCLLPDWLSRWFDIGMKPWCYILGLGMCCLGFVGASATLLGSAMNVEQGVPWLQSAVFLSMGGWGFAVTRHANVASRCLCWAGAGLLFLHWSLVKIALEGSNWPHLNMHEIAVGATYCLLGAVMIARGRQWLMEVSRRIALTVREWRAGEFRIPSTSIGAIRALIAVAIVLAVLCIVYAFENSRGRSAWEAAVSGGLAPKSLPQLSLPAKQNSSKDRESTQDADWLQWHFLFRPPVGPSIEWALNFEQSSFRRQLRSIDTESGSSTNSNQDETISFTADVALFDAIMMLARHARINVWVDADLERSLPKLGQAVNWPEGSPKRALEALLKHHNLFLIAGGSGRTLRLATRTGPDGISYRDDVNRPYLSLDCMVPKSYWELISSRGTTWQILANVRAAKAVTEEVFDSWRAHSLSDFIVYLAKTAGLKASVAARDPLIAEPRFTGNYFGSFAYLSPVVALADLIDLYGYGASFDPNTKTLNVFRKPLLPFTVVQSLIGEREASFVRIRQTAKQLTRLPLPDSRPDVLGDYFLSSRNLVPNVLDSMTRALQFHANVSLMADKKSDCQEYLDALDTVIRYFQGIPTLGSMGEFHSAVGAYCDVVLGGFQSNRWQQADAGKFLACLNTISIESDYLSRLDLESIRIRTVLRDFPRALMVPVLAELDRDPRVKISPWERLELGAFFLATLVCPDGWIQQNLALNELRYQELVDRLRKPRELLDSSSANRSRNESQLSPLNSNGGQSMHAHSWRRRSFLAEMPRVGAKITLKTADPVRDLEHIRVTVAMTRRRCEEFLGLR